MKPVTIKQLKAENAKLKVQLERARGALCVISTWATFEYQGMPAGHALDAADTAQLCEKILKEIE